MIEVSIFLSIVIYLSIYLSIVIYLSIYLDEYRPSSVQGSVVGAEEASVAPVQLGSLLEQAFDLLESTALGCLVELLAQYIGRLGGRVASSHSGLVGWLGGWLVGWLVDRKSVV